MSNTIKIGNLNISSFKVGGSDCSIYLGTVKVYPQAPTFKFSATYSNDTSYSAACDGNTTLTTGTTRAHTTPYSAMTSAVIGDCVTSIGDYAFFYCKNLTSVTISDSVTSIGQYCFESCSGLTSMDLPSGLTSIGTYALHGCRGLTSLDIPSGVTSIGENGIYQCSNLQSITVNATTPPTLGTGAFDQTNECPIYVPCNSVEAYKTAWSTYASRITCNQPSPTGQTPCYAVTDNISQYQATDFVDVYDTTADKWYKLNNLNEYEEYGIYGSGRTNTTYYEGKLTIDDDYEYIYSGNSWVNLGEVSGVTTQTVWYDPPSSGSNNANFNIGHYWGENYKMIYTMYLQGSYSNDVGSFWEDNQKSPLEFHFYNNGYYFDLHNPTSTSSPSVNATDYDYRILKTSVFNNYKSGQVMNVTLTYGSLKVELEESGTVIESTGSTKTGYNWYNGLYEPSITLNNNNLTCHVSRIQVYNASDVLVNDIKFVKNNGVTGSQEISMVDTVLNVVYNNTNGNTPCYHVVEESGGTTYPEYYDEIADPPTSVTFATMADALAYQCPYVGLRATIAGDNYVFNSNYEWEEVTSRLPVGYTEVEYIQNTGTSYLNIAFVPNQDTRVIMEYQLVTDSGSGRFWGAGAWNSATGIEPNYEGGYLQISWLGKSSWTKFNNFPLDYNKHVLDLNKNYLYLDETLVGSNTYTTKTASDNLGVFTYIGSGRPSSSSYWGIEHFLGKMFSFKVYDNDTLVRDLVPCKRDNDNEVGAYDIVNDVFYTVPTGYTTDKLIAGNPV